MGYKKLVREKKKLLFRRIVLGLLLLLNIILPSFEANYVTKNLELVSYDCYITNYYEYIDETLCEAELTFNKDVLSGYVTISFYDDNENLLETKREYFASYGETVKDLIISVSGKVDSYEIIDYEIEPDLSNIYALFLCTGLIFTILFISSLLLNCKKYNYYNIEIIVYAGWFHHYIKVNGTKMDEHNTLIRFTAINLSCNIDEYTRIDARISLSNRISTKVNNVLIQAKKVKNEQQVF